MPLKYEICQKCGKRMHYNHPFWCCETPDCPNSYQYRKAHSQRRRYHIDNSRYPHRAPLQATSGSWDDIIKIEEERNG